MKATKEKLLILLMLLIFLFGLLFVGCAVNYYDEELRNEIIGNRFKILDKALALSQDSKVLKKNEKGKYTFSINYIAGLYRLALLGEGKYTEDEIAKMIEDYKILLKKIRKENK